MKLHASLQACDGARSRATHSFAVKSVRNNSDAASVKFSRGPIPTRSTETITGKTHPKCTKLRWNLVKLCDKERCEDRWKSVTKLEGKHPCSKVMMAHMQCEMYYDKRDGLETTRQVSCKKCTQNAASSWMCTTPGSAACSGAVNC